MSINFFPFLKKKNHENTSKSRQSHRPSVSPAFLAGDGSSIEISYINFRNTNCGNHSGNSVFLTIRSVSEFTHKIFALKFIIWEYINLLSKQWKVKLKSLLFRLLVAR